MKDWFQRLQSTQFIWLYLVVSPSPTMKCRRHVKKKSYANTYINPVYHLGDPSNFNMDWKQDSHDL